MNTLAAEFREIFKIYIKLSEELTKILGVPDSINAQSLIASILKNGECLSRIEQMNSRIQRLSIEWANSQTSLDPESRKEVLELVESIRKQAVQLNDLCNINAEKIQAAKGSIEKDLDELGKGAQFLKSVKPIKNNYPKFIDSHC
jgi:hypothetical protein